MSNRYKFLPIFPEILLDTNSDNAVKLSDKIMKQIFISISTFMWRIKRANIGHALRLSSLLFLFWMSTATVLAVSPPSPSKIYSLAFFAPRGEGDPFWGLFIGFMQKAVDDFGAELRVHYADGNREKMRQQIAIEATSKNRADVLVFPNFKKGGEKFLKIIEENQVPAFVVNSGFTEDEQVGLPREKYKFWIGELLPAEQDVGALLAEKLIEEGLRIQLGSNKLPLEMIGITGIVSDYAAIQRTKGLQQIVKDYPEIRLRQIVPANWSEDDAAKSFSMLKRRYPNVTLIWSASDVMAQGVIRSAKILGLVSGKDFLVGGIDWAQAGLQSVSKGDQHVSIGGHFMEGGWAVVLIYDYLKGSDFAELNLSWRSSMASVIAPEWQKQKKRRESIKPEFIDFKRYSRFLNPENTSYDFGLKSLIAEK